jgi:hypothetical protein
VSGQNLSAVELTMTLVSNSRLEVLAIGANPIGTDGGSALLDTIKASSLKIIDIGKALPIQEPHESDTLDLSKTEIGPGQAVILSWWLSTPAASAAPVSLNMSGNFPTGRISKNDNGMAPWLPSRVFGAWTALCDAVQGSQITAWNISDCLLGPDAMPILATRLSASALASVNFSGNPLTGAEPHFNADHGWEWKNTDSDMAGFIALCGVLGNLNEVDLSDCHLGPASMGELAKGFSDAGASAPNLLALGSNQIGDKAMIQLLDVLKDISLIVFDISNTECGVSTMIKLAAILSGESKFKAAVKTISLSENKLFGHNQHDQHSIDVDQSGWSKLCDALPGSQLESLGLAGVGMGPKGVTSLIKAMSAMTMLTELDISMNRIGSADANFLARAIPSLSLRWLTFGTQMLRVPLHNSEITSLNLNDGARFLGQIDVTVILAAISTNMAVSRVDITSIKMESGMVNYLRDNLPERCKLIGDRWESDTDVSHLQVSLN